MADEATLKFILQDEAAETPAPGSASSDTSPGIPRPVAAPGAAAQAAPTPPPIEIADQSLDPLLGGLYSVQVAVAGMASPEPAGVPSPQPRAPGEAAGPSPQRQQAPIAVGGFGVAEANQPGTPAQPGAAGQARQNTRDRGPNAAETAAGAARTAGTVAGQLAAGQTIPAIGTAGGAAVTALEGLGAAGIVAGGAIAAVGIAAAGAVVGIQAARAALEAMAADVAGFSAELAQAQAQREILRVQRQIERSGTVGNELGDFVRAQAKLEAAVGRAADQIIEVLGPLLTTGVEATAQIVEASEPVVRAATEILVITSPLLNVLRLLKDWLPANDESDKGVDVFDLFLNLPDLPMPGFDPAQGVKLDNDQLGLDLPEGVALP